MEENNHITGDMRKLIGLDQVLLQQKDLEDQFNYLKDERIRCIKALPDLTRRRVRALKKLQMDSIMVEAKFYEEIHALSSKLQEKLHVIHEKRSQVINGSYTPHDEELYLSDPSEDEENPEAPVSNPPGFVDNGVPDFWLTVLKSNSVTVDMIHPQDEPVLQKLKNIEVAWHDAEDIKGFSLIFHFAPNEYFTNEKLTKTYYLRFVPDEEDPFSYDGPEICKCKGCHIDWHKGKNTCLKTVKKKQKHKGGQMSRTVVKSVKVQSFFSFFSPPVAPSNMELIDEDTQEEINSDFEIGYYMKDRLIPRAILYYTGEALDDDDDDDEDEESEAGEEYEESDEEINPAEVKDLLSDQKKSFLS